jgi:hypothetical protein
VAGVIFKDSTAAVLAVLFVFCGAISAYYLVRGFREGRFARRLTFPYPKGPYPDGRERGYAYRDLHTSLFWTEAGMQVLAVAVCIVALFVLATAP